MPESTDLLIRGLRDGNPDALNLFFKQYGPMLQHLADKHLVPGIRRRVGPDTIAQSACLSFLRHAQAGAYTFEDSESLWRLLCAITLTKVNEHVRFHRRAKRSIEREQPLKPPGLDDGSHKSLDPADPRISPIEAVAFEEQFEQIMSQFEPEERQLVDLKLQQLTNEETAELMGCSERTVRRLLQRVKSRLQSNLSPD
jgi:RNA polymerase sigma-70 factor (ECF subfamily)